MSLSKNSTVKAAIRSYDVGPAIQDGYGRRRGPRERNRSRRRLPGVQMPPFILPGGAIRHS